LDAERCAERAVARNFREEFLASCLSRISCRRAPVRGRLSKNGVGVTVG
jgi:hypothetical protein